ncbi:MAG TPA: ECF transporter S component [Dermatophilaceae bacterium]|nr:ECF transporter S component [Dermatophilaceae bacterium]
MTHTTAPAPPRRRRSIRAAEPLRSWRTVDILTVAFLGAAFGVAYWGWGQVYEVPSRLLSAGFPPLAAIFAAPWFLAGVVGGLVVRRPGAAFLCEVVAALVSMLPGTQWGVTTLISGVLQGLGAEAAFALTGYAVFGLGTAVLAGALSAPLEAVYEWFTWWADWTWDWKLAYLLILTAAGAAVAGPLGWLLTRALAASGALAAFPPGQEHRESRAV